MSKKNTSSIEEQIEDWTKRYLEANNLQYLTKTEPLDTEIDDALKSEESKKGGKGGNYPDIKLFIDIDSARVPIMIECKGTKGSLVKLGENGEPLNKKKDGTSNLTNINKYAVNGAVHYATAIFKYADNYSKIIAIGINGYKDGDSTIYEVSAWLISKKNFGLPKKIGEYTDLSFLAVENRNALSLKLKDILLTDAEREKMAFEFENTIEANLKTLNQTMHDDLHIAVGDRVELIAAMIMAGLGVKDEDGNVLVNSLMTIDLKGDKGRKNHDGYIIYNKVADFLEEKNLPADKRASIKNTLERVLLHSNLEIPRKVKNTSRFESRLKTVYREVEQNIMPTFLSAEHLDFTGKLFNVLNEWVDIPDGERNDVVLTPRYITEFMAKLTEVNMNSYVWDYAAGSGGFLISAMKLMLKDAEQRYKSSPQKYVDKVSDIKKYQLLGCEIRPDIYLLAVLNMILMKDGSATILNVDSLEKFSGTYEQGDRKGKDFPADVFLLNPPYSAPGKGFIFVEKALSRMKNGKACVLIQENAGSGYGLPYTKHLLKHNTLLASIHMSDIFNGKASVQTAIYLFDVGRPHNENKYVKFIDFSDDGYTRSNRKKSSLDVNLRDTGNAIARYQEVADVILGRKLLKDCEYLTDETYIEDKITPEGNDWTFNQHKKIDLIPTDDDLKKVIADYLAWKVGAILRGEIEVEKAIIEKSRNIAQNTEKVQYRMFRIVDLFDIIKGKRLTRENQITGSTPFIGSTENNNGITAYIGQEPIYKENAITISYNGSVGQVFYQEKPFWASDDINVLYFKHKKLNSLLFCYLGACLKKSGKAFSYTRKWNLERMKSSNIVLPICLNNDGTPIIDPDHIYHPDGYIPDWDYMQEHIWKLEHERIAELYQYLIATGLIDCELTKEEINIIKNTEAPDS